MQVSAFLAEFKARAFVQSQQSVLSDAELITICNRAIQSHIVPKFISARQRYFQAEKRYTLNGVSKRFRTPTRAIGGRIYDIKVIDSSGSEYSLNQVPPQDVSTLRQGFYLEDGDIVLLGNQLPTGTMIVYYPIAPPQMSTTATTPSISVTVVGSSSITTSGSPGAGTFDVVRSGQPVRVISPNVTFSASTGTNQDSSDYTLFQVGDLVLPAQNTVDTVPFQDDYIEWILLRCAVSYLKTRGFHEEAKSLKEDLAEAEKSAMVLIDPRVTDKEQVIGGMEALGWRTW